ncbi:CHASE2 domain-containing protein [Acidovorax radicis]|nr:CHASE2 domain-containing protein [Acidovorax radicis]
MALVVWLSTSGDLDRANHVVQDAGLRLAARPSHPDIVVVAIDDRSIAAIGRWPWRRALHAELITRLSAQNPRVIGVDVLLGEADLDYPDDDLLLADAIRRSGRVVLPVLRRGFGPASHLADLPLPPFAQAAANLGHVHVAPDGDGVVRSLYMYEGSDIAPWHHFSMAMQSVADARTGRPPCTSAPVQPIATGPWKRKDLTLIAYAGGASPFTSYSYIDVLRGQVPVNAFQNKYVLVGAVASGLGDIFATPMSQHSRLMSGVEVVANVLNARLSSTQIHPASMLQNTLFNLVPVACALMALLMAGPFAAMLISGGVALATLLLSVALPWWAGLQFAPAAAVVGIALAYPLWSWRRLSAAADFLQREMTNLKNEGLSMRKRRRPGDSEDFLERRINAVERASRQLRDLHHFVKESLQQLPSPTFVCDAQGNILLANNAAHSFLGVDMHHALQRQSVVDLLVDLVHIKTGQPLITHHHLSNGSLPEQVEGRDRQGRNLLVQCKPLSDIAQADWLLSLVDLTDMRRALQQRNQAMHFISHDIRAPNASILTLLEMQRVYPERMSHQDLMQRIERYAQVSLGMAESFVRLASAESQEYRMVALDMTAVLEEAVDDLWALAQDHGVTVIITSPLASAPLRGDRALLCRSLANVINNAIKFSPRDAVVQCSLTERNTWWVLSVRDTGPGIAPELQGQLFAPFQRLHDHSHPSIQGVGLGLALVHTVVVRHGGTLEVDSEPGRGTEFRLVLPKQKDQQQDAQGF